LVEWRVQAYDATINALTKVAAWPATGINPTPTYTGPVGAGLGVIRTANICMASADKVATCNGWVLLSAAGRPAISVFNASNGADLDSGDANVTTGAAVMPSGGICSDGSTIYWTAQDGGGTFAAVLQASQVSAPDTVAAGWTKIALGNASGATASRCHSVCWDGEAVWCPLEDGTVITASTGSKGAAYTAYAAHPKVDFLGYCAFDGLRVWMLGHATGTDAMVAMGIDASLAHAFAGGLGLSELWPRMVPLMRVAEHGSPADVTDYGTMLFDGDALWCLLNDQRGLATANLIGFTRAIRASSRR
jgi:hypothetical protein